MPDIADQTWLNDAAGLIRRATLDNARLAVLGVVNLIAASGLIIATTELQREQQDAVAWVAHTLEVLGNVASLDAHLESAVSNERGYVVSRDPADQVASDAAARQVRESLAELRRLTADDPVQQDAVARLDEMIGTRLDTLRRTADNLITLDPHAIPNPALLATARTSAAEVARELGAVKAEEQRLLAQRQARLASINTWLWGQLVTCGIIVAAGFALMLAIIGGSRRKERDVVAMRQQNAALEASVAERTRSLALSEAKLRAYFEHSATGILVLRRSAEGDITFDTVNPAYAAMTGLTQAMVEGHAIEDIWPMEYAASVRGRVTDALQAGVSKAFTVQRPLRGEMRWLDGIVTPVPSGDHGEACDLVVASVRDVTHERALTDQLVAEAQAAGEAAERDAAVFQHAPGVMTVVGVREQDGDMQYVYEAVSPAFEAIVGWKAADLIGKSPTTWMQPVLAEQVLSFYRQSVETGEPVAWKGGFETARGRFNGEGIVTPVHDPVTGKVTRLIVTVRDMAEHIHTQPLIEPVRQSI